MDFQKVVMYKKNPCQFIFKFYCHNECIQTKCKCYAAALGSTAFGSNVANDSRGGHSRLSNVFEMLMFPTLKMFVLPEINTENGIQVNMNNFYRAIM